MIKSTGSVPTPRMRMMKVKRNKIIIRLRNKGWTYRLIGDILGISRQRVEQIYRRDRDKYRLSPWRVLLKRMGLRFFG